ncbi:MAG TPA: HAD hydrolase-like protein, partial [Pseudonocardiaceae bacterium]|nr:HAD hydrolase-like protein [Pseudonocardiaceae bacterium]
VQAYLSLHGLGPYVAQVAAREAPDPTLLKPSPHLLEEALRQLGRPPGAAAFVGDSSSDIESAIAAGVRSIGYANKPGKAKVLASANVVVKTMDQLVRSIQVS